MRSVTEATANGVGGLAGRAARGGRGAAARAGPRDRGSDRRDPARGARVRPAATTTTTPPSCARRCTRPCTSSSQRIADPATSRETTAELFTGIGRIEAAEGRSLEPLQAALRLGARVTWRRPVRAGRPGQPGRRGHRPGRRGAVPVHRRAGRPPAPRGSPGPAPRWRAKLERRRRRLLDLVVTEPPVSRDAITDLARAAGWPLPRKVAVVALEDRSQDRFGPLPALPPGRARQHDPRRTRACWCRTRTARAGRT